MSILPSIRSAGSSSRLADRVSIPSAAYAQSRRRYAAQSKQSGPIIGTSVQDADKALQTLAQNMARMKKNGRAVDLSGMATPIMERLVEPRYRISWLFRTGGWTYFKDRLVRFRTTRHFLNEMIQRRVFEKQKGRLTGLLTSIRCISPTFKAKALVQELQEVYEDLNKAQAAGNEAAVRSLATGDALNLAQNVARTKRNMQWELVRMNEPPRVMSARLAPLDPENNLELAQVVVRFDSDQALSFRNQKGVERKQQRVVENCVFERHLPVVRGWRLKGTLPMTEPDVAR